LRKLLARPRSSSPSSRSYSFDIDSSSSSSDYGSDDSTSRTDFSVASQNAWGSGDMGAYDRIQAGTPTGEDCAIHGF
jgi:hypothetical protein